MHIKAVNLMVGKLYLIKLQKLSMNGEQQPHTQKDLLTKIPSVHSPTATECFCFCLYELRSSLLLSILLRPLFSSNLQPDSLSQLKADQGCSTKTPPEISKVGLAAIEFSYLFLNEPSLSGYKATGDDDDDDDDKFINIFSFCKVHRFSFWVTNKYFHSKHIYKWDNETEWHIICSTSNLKNKPS